MQLPLLAKKQLTLFIKREDLLHPFVSGNKFRKLKYNLITASTLGHDTLLTFGGAYSNHIAATAYAATEHGLKSIGIIRGAELQSKWQDNPTLKFASDHGMKFKFISREAYRAKGEAFFLKNLEGEFGRFFMLPEGGANLAAVRGCEEILSKEDQGFDLICSSVGTGATLAGISNASMPDQRILGFPALKGDYLKEDIRKFAQKENWDLQSDYHFGGYAKIEARLIQFLNDFKESTGIPLDPIYTGKMVYGILDLAKQDFFSPHTSILAIHTGGLQGIAGMNQVLRNKNLPLIDL